MKTYTRRKKVERRKIEEHNKLMAYYELAFRRHESPWYESWANRKSDAPGGPLP